MQRNHTTRSADSAEGLPWWRLDFVASRVSLLVPVLRGGDMVGDCLDTAACTSSPVDGPFTPVDDGSR